MEIETFKASFNDMLRPNRFEVNFSAPFNNEMKDLQIVTTLCKSTSFPFPTLEKNETIYNSRKLKVASGIDYDPISFVFMVDVDRKVLSYLTKWYRKVAPLKQDNSGEHSHTFAYPKDYYGVIQIDWYNRAYQTVAAVELRDAYPTNIDSIALSMDSNDQVAEITCSFEYNSLVYRNI